MEIIKTDSFELAVNILGDENAERFIFCLPGRLDTKDYASMQSHIEFFASKGFCAVSFDPPGTWESPGDTSLYSQKNYLQAIDELIAYFGNKPTVLLGHSRGGTMAMLAGIRNAYVSHIISIMSNWGPSDKPESTDLSYVTHRDLPPGTSRTIERKRFELDWSYFDDTTEYIGLDTCSKPKLFFAGTQDVLVTPESVKNTFDIAAEPKLFYELESEHDYRLQPAIIKEVNEVVLQFLN